MPLKICSLADKALVAGLNHPYCFICTGLFTVSTLLALLQVNPRVVFGLARFLLGRGLYLEGALLAVLRGPAVELPLALGPVHPWNLQ
jgi:hypothetical protein